LYEVKLISKDVFIINLTKKGKNPVQFSNKDTELITTIGLQLSAKILSILEMSEKNQIEYIKNLLIRSSKTNHSIIHTIITSIILQSDQSLFLPKDIKIKIIENLNSLENESSKIYSYNISKILKEMERDNVVQNIKTKKEIRNHGFSKGFKNKKSEEGGYPSIYILSPNIQEYKRILNNQKAIDRINQLLKKYGKLDQFYSLLCESLLKTIISNPDEIRKSLELMNKNMGSPLDNTEANFSNWNSMIEGAKLLSEKEINDLCKDSVNNFIDNPNSFLYICLLIGSN
jgi:hypothetical protein